MNQPNSGIGFDEMPIPAATHSSNHFAIPEFAQSQQHLFDTTNLTLTQKLASKGIKVRMQGIQELFQTIQRVQQKKNTESDEEVLNSIQMSKVLKENNPACIQKALLCMNEWMKLKRAWGNPEIKQAIESGFINGKGNAKKSALQTIEKMFESKGEQFENSVLEGLKIKTPKIIGGYLGILNEILSSFGVKALKFLKPYLTDIVRIMNTQKLPAVKNEGMNLLKAGYKWIGKDFFAQYTKDLKQNIVKELDHFWESHDKSEKMVSKKDNEKKPAEEKREGEESQVQQNETLDLFQISEAVDILKDFDEKWADSVLTAQKWSIKVKLLQDLQAKASVPKIKNRESRHLVEMIRRLLNDSNFNVVLNTLKVAGLLAKGLRKSFYNPAKMLFSLILVKFRDKKTQMIEQTFTTMNNLSYAISLEDVGDDIKLGLKDKTPSAKQHLINWIFQILSKNDKIFQKTLDFLNSLNDSMDKLLADPSCEVRDAATKLQSIIKGGSPDAKILQMSQSKAKQSKISEKGQSRIDRSRSADKSRKLSSSKNKSEMNTSKIVELDSGISDIVNDFPRILKKLNDSGNWQNRKEAAEQLSIRFQQLSVGQAKLPSVSIMHDFFGIIKSRISDPNKQLIKIFINLIGNTFLVLTEKEAKIQYRVFTQSLAEALSDKNEVNKRQIFKTLDIMGEIVSQQQILIAMVPCMINQNNYRVYCLEYMLIWEESLSSLNKNDLKDFPKMIINCLCDKNRQIKAKSQSILKIISNSIGIQSFKNVIKDVKLAFKNQLTSLVEKCYGNITSSIITENSFYSTKSINQKQTSRKASPSASKYDLSKNKYGQKSHSKLKDTFLEENSSHYGSHINNTSSLLKSHIGVVENDFFANISVLTEERIQREEKQQRYRNNFTAINFWEQNKASIQKLMNYEQFASKMLADDYRLNIQGSAALIKICRDSSQHNSIRQIYDIIMKWVVIKLYGGNPALIQLIEVISPILSILEKKKIAFSQKDIDLLFEIIREYALGSYLIESTNFETLKSIMVISVALSSGERLLKKILADFKFDCSVIHKHCRKHLNQGYRAVLVYLCQVLADYFSNDTLLMEAGKIPELSNNSQFYKKLKQKFHENILGEFGFYPESSRQQNSLVRDCSAGKDEVKTSFVNSRLDSKNQDRSRSKKKSQNQSQAASKVSHPTHSYDCYNIEDDNPKFGLPSQSFWPEPIQSQSNFSRNSSSNFLQTHKMENEKGSHMSEKFQKKYIILEGDCDHEIDLTKYATVNSLSPLGSNLSRLYPPDDKAIGFFTTLMQGYGQKITEQLVRNCDIIYSSIFNTLIRIMKNRDDFSPQKIISFTNLAQLSIRCTHIFKKIQESLISHSCQFIVNQLVYEDQNRVLIQSKLRQKGYTDLKSDCFIKAINGIMLRILDNTPPLFVTNILLEMLTVLNSKKQTNCQTNNKKIGLIIRCITRVSSAFFNPQSPNYLYEKDRGDRMIITFFAIAKEYLDVMGIMSLVNEQKKYGQTIQKNSKSEESIAQTIYNVLHVISKQTAKEDKQKIWKLYTSFKEDLLSLREEILIKEYLEFVVGPQKPPEEVVSSSYFVSQHKKEGHSKNEEQLRQIIELLAKARTFEEGISYLKTFIAKNRAFDIDQYFQKMNFDRNFVQKVKNQLKSLTLQTPKNGLNPDIQNKLDSLKKKLQIMQVKGPVESQIHKRDKSSHRVENAPRGENLTPKSRRDYSSNAPQGRNNTRDESHNDVKKRIEDMKNRIHMTATNRLR